MTLLDILAARGNDDDKKRILALVKDIRRAIQDAALDAEAGEMKPDYGTGDNKSILKKIYETEYKKLIFGKADKTEVEDKLHYDKGLKDGEIATQIRNPDYVEVDATGKENKKYSKKQIAAYNLGYDIGRAKVDGTRDGAIPNKTPDETYGKGKDVKVQKTYDEAFKKSKVADKNEGLADGLAGKKKRSKYEASSSSLGLSPDFSAMIGLYQPIAVKAERYQEGYNIGLKYLADNIESLKSKAIFNGHADGAKDSKYASKILYDYKDEAGFTTQSFIDFNDVDTSDPTVKELKSTYDKAFKEGKEAIQVSKGGRTRRRKQKKSSTRRIRQ
jgi:hypothetical protein